MQTASYWQHRNRKEPVDADVVVVGAGIVGCSAAYWLRSLSQSLRVVVVEKDVVASGATGRNAGFLLQGSSTAYARDVERYGRRMARLLWEVTLENRNLIADRFRGESVGFIASGSCTAAGSTQEAEKLHESARLLVEDGYDAEYLDASRVNGLLESTGFYGGLLVGSGAVVDPVLLTRKMITASGARVIERLAVRSVTGSHGDSVELDCGATTVTAVAAVITVNAYLPLLEPDLASFVRPVRAQMLATAPVDGKPLPMPVYSHDGYYYVRQSYDGGLLVGGARHLHRNVEEGYSVETSEALQSDLSAYLSNYFPGRSGAPVERKWAGTMGFSPDGLPVWGHLPDVPGALWVAGFTGHGMSIAFALGRIIAQRILGEPESELMTLLRSDRFLAGS